MNVQARRANRGIALTEAHAIELLPLALGLPSGVAPFPWQVRLLKLLIAGEIPTAIDLPTGLGKTSVIAIWLLARAAGGKIPLRLVYVVDRRAVFDQASAVADHLADLVKRTSDFANALGVDGNRGLAVSTLRGQHIDNRRWLDDPSAPAIVVGTVDMIGSRLTRHKETLTRIQHNDDGNLFVQASKARFDRVSYDGAERWLHFELSKYDGTGFVAWPLERAHELVKKVRHAARARLDGAFGVEEGQKRLPMQNEPRSSLRERLRFIPLSSRGHDETNPSIRRVVVGVPLSMALADAEWLLSALAVDEARLVGAQDTVMWQRYTQASMTWQTVTPAILTPRRRLEPTKHETKDAAERQKEEHQARQAVLQALRQAEVKGRSVQVDVQREPWEKRGRRAEFFTKNTRFEKERAWHVRVTFAQPVTGPVAIGDGRFAGLGVMAPPLRERVMKRVDGDDVIVLRIDAGLKESASSTGIADAFRRALMARTQEQIGSKDLPAWLTGHLWNGDPVRDERGRLRLVADLERQRLLALVPMFSMRERAEIRDEVITALSTMRELKAGAGGRLLLRRVPLDARDVLFASGRRWATVNDYLVNRHDQGCDLHALVVNDVRAECARRRLPSPHIDVLSTSVVKGTGIFAKLELTFAVDVTGPSCLGETACSVVGCCGPPGLDQPGLGA